MSSIKPVEKMLFEDLFGMSSGYVMNFTNSSFADFFRDTIGIDIYSDKYDYIGDSKAKRLRAFWEIEPDKVVARILLELLTVWKYEMQKNGKDFNTLRYSDAKKIIARLKGDSSATVDLEQEFLSKQFENISIEKIQIDGGMVPILNFRLVEAQQCFAAGSSLAVVFMCGSILEGLLLGVAEQKPRDFNTFDSAPKDESGKVKRFHEWSLAQFIDVAYGLGLLKLDVKKFSHVLRDFRNYIHPYEQRASRFQPDRHTAEICLQVLKAAIASLSGERN